MTIAEAVRRLFAGSLIERATVDMAQFNEDRPRDLPLGIREPRGYRPRDLTAGQLRRLRELNPSFAEAEHHARARKIAIDAQRRRHGID